MTKDANDSVLVLLFLSMGVVYDKFAEKLAKKIGDKLPRATIRETQPRRILVADVRGDVHGDTEDWLVSVTDFAEEHFKRRFASEDRLQTIRATVRTKEDGECETLTRLSVERDWFDDLDDPEEEEESQERVSDEIEAQDLIPITAEDGTTHWVTERIAEKYMQMRRIRELELRTDDMQDKTLERFAQMSTPTETAQKIATGMLAGAARYQDRAATAWETQMEKKYETEKLETDMAKVEVEEAGKKERAAARNKFWAPYGDAVLKQFGAHVKKKMKMNGANAEGVEDAEDEDEAEIAHEEGLTDDERENPAATLARNLGRMLEPEQWFALFKTLEEASVVAFQRLVLAQTDAAVKEAWEAVNENVSTPELMKLDALLTPEQKVGLETLGEAIG